MPVAYTRDDDIRRIVVTMTDPLPLDEMLGAIERQALEGTWQYGVLNDSRALSTTFTSSELGKGLDLVKKLSHTYGRRGPVAIVAGRPVQFGMTRMYSVMSETTFEVEAFHEIHDAERWLDQRLAP